MSTILTGIRANSDLHIGNYIGAIFPMIQLSRRLTADDTMYFFIPDLHSFTTPTDHSRLYQSTIDNARYYIAAGLQVTQPNIHIFRQSYVPAHSELTWILSCFGYYGEVQRMIQFKEKSTKEAQNVTVGLFTYPLLMAADMLLYDAEYVPLGDDQRQHLEWARDWSIRINNKFIDSAPDGVLVPPKPWKDQQAFIHRDEGMRIRSLSNPESKMSKSVIDPKGTILLGDEPAHAAKKIMSATTDSLASIKWDWQNQPGITNLLQLYSVFSGLSVEQTRSEWEGQEQYGALKKSVAGQIESFLSHLQENVASLTNDKVEKYLNEGEIKANTVANRRLHEVQKVVGLRKQ
jgi:tryptophanyl-tRNA synthetase